MKNKYNTDYRKVLRVANDVQTLELENQLNQIHSDLYGTGNPEIDEAILDDKTSEFRKNLKQIIKNGN